MSDRKVKLLSARDVIRQVAARWRESYGHKPADYRLTGDRDPYAILRNLEALDKETATASDVERIIGTSGWGSPPCCGSCDLLVNEVAHLGDEADYESTTFFVCEDCLRAALALFRHGGVSA